MPSKNIVVVLIICIAIITSVWIYQRSTVSAPIAQKTSGLQVEKNLIQTGDVATDWKKILTQADNSSVQPLASSASGKDEPLDTTVTAQVARDFFSQYLLAIKGGQNLSDTDASQIAANTLSVPEYTNAQGVTYSISDVHVSNDTSQTAESQYSENLVTSIIRKSPRIPMDEMQILDGAIKNNDPSAVAQMDPIIGNYKRIISELLQMSVPRDAANLHVELLNSTSNVLSNLEGLRQTFTDPIRSFVAYSQYKQHIMDLAGVINKYQSFFGTKGITAHVSY